MIEETINLLRYCLGYVENGSSRSLSIFQDEMTKEWVIHVGDSGKRRMYVGNSFDEVIRKAGEAEKEFNQ